MRVTGSLGTNDELASGNWVAGAWSKGIWIALQPQWGVTHMSFSLLRIALVSSLLGACASGAITGNVEGYVDNGDGVPTFKEFEEATYLEPMAGGVYIVNGDTPIANEKQLREYYQELFYSSLIVDRRGGTDSKWDQNQQHNLSYCISNSFGQYKSQVVSAMAQATTNGWETAADVHFIYDSSQDANCTSSNNNVLFDVNPTSGAPYLARAFFPGQGRSSRNVIVDTSSFNSGWPLSAVLSHELGHSLGFRHEHTRPEAGTCFEDNAWRPLTPYDSSSIMHYPQCNGASNTLSFSQRDFDGVALLYGAPSGTGTDPDPVQPGVGTPSSDQTTGSVSAGQNVNYSPIPVLAGTSLQVQMTGSGDADLYVRFGSAPTKTAYDCRPYLNGSAETCTLDVPAGASQAHIMVNGYTAASYSLTVNWTAP